MRQWVLAFLLVAMLVGLMMIISMASQGPGLDVNAQPDVAAHRRDVVVLPSGGRGSPSSGILRIDNSTVNYVAPVELPASLDSLLCFNVTVDSPDLEYLDRFDVDLPDNWDVFQVVPVPDTGCGLGATEGVEVGNVVYWQTLGFPSYCGAWKNGTYDFCAMVNVPDCSGGPWSFQWNIVGDGYGDPPHQVSGSAGPVTCLTLDLSPSVAGEVDCYTMTKSFTLNLFNHTGSSGTFSLTYEVPSGNAALSGPDQIYLGNGVDQDLQVDFSPSQCMPLGQYLTGTVTASGGGFEDTSLVEWVVHASGHPGCPRCNPAFLPLVRKN
jgi:hypothetical protein